MRADDFFATAEELAERDKEGTVTGRALRSILRHFGPCIDAREVRKIDADDAIPDGNKLDAIREKASGILRSVRFSGDKHGLAGILKKGIRHKVVKDFLEDEEWEVLVFRVPSMGDYVIHALGEGPNAVKEPRIVIPGDAVMLTVQSLAQFAKEHVN